MDKLMDRRESVLEVIRTEMDPEFAAVLLVAVAQGEVDIVPGTDTNTWLLVEGDDTVGVFYLNRDFGHDWELNDEWLYSKLG